MWLTTDLVLKLLLAMLLGGLIGAEREYRSKSAGLRTLIMICLGATIFTILSIQLGGKNSPDRIASNVVVGIGFVGAGVVFKGRGSRVNGITTAATIWVTAALGVAIGAGREAMAILGCVLVLAILFLFTRFQDWIDKANQIRTYRIVCPYAEDTLHRFEKLFGEHGLRSSQSRQIKTGNTITGIWLVQGSEQNHLGCIRTILKDASVNTFEF